MRRTNLYQFWKGLIIRETDRKAKHRYLNQLTYTLREPKKDAKKSTNKVTFKLKNVRYHV